MTQAKDLNSTISDFLLGNIDIADMTYRIKELKLASDKNEFSEMLNKTAGKIDSISYIINHLHLDHCIKLFK
jgi:hypothetical protein